MIIYSCKDLYGFSRFKFFAVAGKSIHKRIGFFVCDKKGDYMSNVHKKTRTKKENDEC